MGWEKKKKTSHDLNHVPTSLLFCCVVLFSLCALCAFHHWERAGHNRSQNTTIRNRWYIPGTVFPFFSPSHVLSSSYSPAPPSRNSDPGSHSGHCSPLPTTVRSFIFIGRRIHRVSSLVDSRRITWCLVWYIIYLVYSTGVCNFQDGYFCYLLSSVYEWVWVLYLVFFSFPFFSFLVFRFSLSSSPVVQ